MPRTWVDVLKETRERSDRSQTRGMWWVLIPLGCILGAAFYGYEIYTGADPYISPREAQDSGSTYTYEP